MAERDWEGLATALEAATGDYSRAELVDLLRDLIAEYVVGRGLPTGSPSAAATPDVAAMNFADLVRWLKRASSAPELQRFSVDGQRVVVDLDGPRVISGASDGARAPAAAPGTGAPGAGFVDVPMRRPAAAPAGNAPNRPAAGSAAGNTAGNAAGNATARPAAGARAGNPAENPVRPAPPLPPPADAPAGNHEDGTPKRGLSKGFRGLEFD